MLKDLERSGRIPGLDLRKLIYGVTLPDEFLRTNKNCKKFKGLYLRVIADMALSGYLKL